MRYRLTGNFQYDLGIYGLKVVLDFFKKDYSYGDFWLEVDKSSEEILELNIYQSGRRLKEFLIQVGVTY